MLNMKEIFTIRFIKGYLSRNSTYILLSLFIFIVAMLFGFYFNGYLNGAFLELSYTTNMATSLLDEITNNFLDIFSNNLRIDVSVILFGFLFSIGSIIITFINGVLIGYFFAKTNLLIFIVGIVPHGIFEIPSSVIAMGGSIIATIWEIKMIQAFLSKDKNIHEEYSKNKYMLKDVIATIIYVFILLLIAALIESTITPLLLIITLI